MPFGESPQIPSKFNRAQRESLENKSNKEERQGEKPNDPESYSFDADGVFALRARRLELAKERNGATDEPVKAELNKIIDALKNREDEIRTAFNMGGTNTLQ